MSSDEDWLASKPLKEQSLAMCGEALCYESSYRARIASLTDEVKKTSHSLGLMLIHIGTEGNVKTDSDFIKGIVVKLKLLKNHAKGESQIIRICSTALHLFEAIKNNELI